MKMLQPISTALAVVFFIGMTASHLSAADIVKVDDLLNTVDLQSYYNLPCKVVLKETDAKDNMAGAKISELTFISTGPEPLRHLATLTVFQWDSPATALKTAVFTRDKSAKSGDKIEDMTKMSDLAFWLHNIMFIAKGRFTLNLNASGLTEHDDQAQARAAALVLSKKILERLK